MKGTKFLLKEVWVCLFCLFLFTVMFSWRTTSASILSKAYNFFIFFFYQAMLFERMFCVLDVGDNQYCTGRVQKAAVWVLHLFCPSSMVLRQLLNCRHVKKNPLNCMDYKYIYKWTSKKQLSRVILPTYVQSRILLHLKKTLFLFAEEKEGKK